MMIDLDLSIRPLILAPAGGRKAFLAAVAAGADAVYCGLKSFSARMEAKNFTIETLYPLAELARQKNVELYIALNSLIKPDELSQADRILRQLEDIIKPSALIIQDLGVAAMARDVGFSGELHLSTLASFSFSYGFSSLRDELKISRIVLPRELTIDEIKLMAKACPPQLGLEVFVHGALCFGVSGRCYWSSYLGGKSGLRGRCVQPCRRWYVMENQRERFFSCKDLSLDVLVKALKPIPQIRAWKIEGRKKGAHYVYYTVQAYKLLRDYGHDPAAKRDALKLLEQSLSRPGTHYYFLPQRPQAPVTIQEQTCSGLLIGRVKGTGRNTKIAPYQPLLPGDVLRVGDEDLDFHSVIRVNRFVPAKSSLFITLKQGSAAPKGTPVYLTDRCEPGLEKMIAALEPVCQSVPTPDDRGIDGGHVIIQLQKPLEPLPAEAPQSISVMRKNLPQVLGSNIGLWLAETDISSLKLSPSSTLWWWLPPVVWPEEEHHLKQQINELTADAGQRCFVLNAPWQTGLFDDPRKYTLWAGPFCNVSYPKTAEVLKSMGIAGIIISPELGRNDILSLPQTVSLPTGIVIQGLLPLCIARTRSEITTRETIYRSPKNETVWTVKYGQNLWIYPDWKIDLREHQAVLQQAGYRLFFTIEESLPQTITLKKRPGVWNWNLKLL